MDGPDVRIVPRPTDSPFFCVERRLNGANDCVPQLVEAGMTGPGSGY